MTRRSSRPSLPAYTLAKELQGVEVLALLAYQYGRALALDAYAELLLFAEEDAGLAAVAHALHRFAHEIEELQLKIAVGLKAGHEFPRGGLSLGPGGSGLPGLAVFAAGSRLALAGLKVAGVHLNDGLALF
jgi:hypothetical protein